MLAPPSVLIVLLGLLAKRASCVAANVTKTVALYPTSNLTTTTPQSDPFGSPRPEWYGLPVLNVTVVNGSDVSGCKRFQGLDSKVFTTTEQGSFKAWARPIQEKDALKMESRDDNTGEESSCMLRLFWPVQSDDDWRGDHSCLAPKVRISEGVVGSNKDVPVELTQDFFYE